SGRRLRELLGRHFTEHREDFRVRPGSVVEQGLEIGDGHFAPGAGPSGFAASDLRSASTSAAEASGSVRLPSTYGRHSVSSADRYVVHEPRVKMPYSIGT